MYALSPVVGYLSDRIGRVQVAVLGQAIFVLGAIVTVVWGSDTGQVMPSLFLLGLGWSCSSVSCSILLSESVDAAHRTAAQGLSDTTMNSVAALSALASGPLLTLVGFGGLGASSLLLSVPLIIYALLLPATGWDSKRRPA
jgi:MFS family permease